ncbi:MAG: class I SAM-dependent methyltransferase [Acidobacteria bacterium]|nr:class I SAM-dependent methyltransferase [Acidobacteriota bacterium]
MRRINRLLERDLVPDVLIRAGIRQLLRDRLRQLHSSEQPTVADFAAMLRQSPIALNTAEANQQHYEVPTEFFQRVLGQHLKYSCGYWPDAVTTLDQSEAAMLHLTAERAQLAEGQQILDLGCGWGALSLFIAQQFPHSFITAVSNSRTQKEFIEAEARRRSLDNLRVLTVDMNSFSATTIGDTRFDRIVSVEMFEHMRNHALLLERLAGLLQPTGKLFIHIFTHRTHAYLYEVQDDTDWMARYFFTGGMMPSADLLAHFPDHFRLAQQWQVNGKHYEKTCRAWLGRMDAQRREIMPLLAQTYGDDQAIRWWVYWRIFFLACAELFAFRRGEEWFVSHYLLEPQTSLKD